VKFAKKGNVNFNLTFDKTSTFWTGEKKDESNFGVGDPDPDPQDPHVFGPPGSRSISQRYGSGTGSFIFLIKGVGLTEIMLAK